MAKVTWNDKAILSLTKSIQLQSMNEATSFLSTKVKDSMLPGTGNIWPSKKGDGSLHQASIPGVAPAPDTEELKDSIYEIVLGGTANTNIIGKVGTNNFKGIIHELGYTINGDKRPFLRPALDKNSDEIIKILGKNKI